MNTFVLLVICFLTITNGVDCETALESFNRLDKDLNGVTDAAEVLAYRTELFASLGIDFPPEILDSILATGVDDFMQYFDVDGDGIVTFEDFSSKWVEPVH